MITLSLGFWVAGVLEQAPSKFVNGARGGTFPLPPWLALAVPLDTGLPDVVVVTVVVLVTVPFPVIGVAAS